MKYLLFIVSLTAILNFSSGRDIDPKGLLADGS